MWLTRLAHSRRPMPLQVAVMGASRSTAVAGPTDPMIIQTMPHTTAEPIAARADGHASLAVGSAQHRDDAGSSTGGLRE